MLARALRQLERPDEEIATQAAKAATVGARGANIQVQAGYILIDARDVEAARVCVARAEESADDRFVFAVELDGLKGRIAARDGEFAKAEEMFRSVLRREPQWSSNWIQLARFLWARGRNEEALTVLAESLNWLREKDRGQHTKADDFDSLERLQSEIAGDSRTEPAD